MKNGWIAVDLDGTLAEYHGWDGGRLGEPIPLMVARIKQFLDEGWEVRIFTARITHPEAEGEKQKIQDWLQYRAGLPRLEVTATKDFSMVELWDDRAVQVQKNTGKVRPKGVWVDNA